MLVITRGLIVFFGVLSLIATSAFFGSFGQSVASITLLSALGAGFDVSKLLFLNLTTGTKTVTKALSMGVYTVLMLLSIVSCMGILCQSEKVSIASSEVAQRLSREHAVLNKQLATLVDVQAADARLGYRQRALSVSKDIAQKQSEIALLDEQMTSMPSAGVLSSVSEEMSLTLPFQNDAIKQWLIVGLSCLLELMLVALVLAKKTLITKRKLGTTEAHIVENVLGPKAHPNVVPIRARDKQNTKGKRARITSLGVSEHIERTRKCPGTPASTPNHGTQIAKMKHDMQIGRVKPCIRDCKKQYSRGTTYIKNCFDVLVEEGFLKKVNKRYSLSANFQKSRENSYFYSGFVGK